MRILLAEDDDRKRTQIETYLRTTVSFLDLKVARSLQSGVDALLEGEYDLVLLDMSMPTFDVGYDESGEHESGGSPQPFAGWDLLRQMERHEISIPVILITGYESFRAGEATLTLPELHETLRLEFGNTYAGHVFYTTGVSGWKEQLRILLTEIHPLIENEHTS